MSFPPVPGAATNLHGLKLQATTGINGFALQDATPTILSWTPPSDGNLHRVILAISEYVSSATTGGSIEIQSTGPNGITIPAPTVLGSSLALGWHFNDNLSVIVPSFVLIAPGSVFAVTQITPVSVGVATVWAEIWGS
jgi:hypothetical protein